MGKPTGFLEYERQLPEDRPPKERMKDWNEFHTHFDLEKLRLQGARCMDCGIPFCHTGKQIGRTSIGCPLNNLPRIYGARMSCALRGIVYSRYARPCRYYKKY